MRRITAAVSPFSVLTVCFTASLLLAASALAACAKDAADTGGSDDAGGATIPDSFTYYDNAIPPSPPPPPPPVCAGTGAPCHVNQSDCPPPPNIFTPPFNCAAATAPSDAGAVDSGDAGPPPDGVCISGFDFVDCTGGKCGGSRCLLAANKCLGAAEVPCVCGDGGSGSPCGQ